MEFQVELMPKAVNDLDEITWHIAQDNFLAAKQFYQTLIERTTPLASFPEMGRTVPEFNNAILREIACGSYRIIYRVVKRARRIEILRFWHAARGTPKI